jgi:hypothetical protein
LGFDVSEKVFDDEYKNKRKNLLKDGVGEKKQKSMEFTDTVKSMY